MRIRSLVPLLAALGLAVALGPGASPAVAANCVDVDVYHGFPGVTGEEITTSPGLGCRGARTTMMKYFDKVLDSAQTPGGCAWVRDTKGCRVGGFRCYTRYRYSESTLRGVCKGKRGRVRFRERDRGPY